MEMSIYYKLQNLDGKLRLVINVNYKVFIPNYYSRSSGMKIFYEDVRE